ncbi:MAG: zf-HC2 domain-containing protein [candidate division KSB1 bacterium]|nr:zf-HC2 domain-containing protein [candidate division KSB1 bacterium]
MLCEKYKDTAVLYLYNELDTETNRDFKTHLKRCAQCRKAVKELQSAAQLVDQLPEESVDADVIQNILQHNVRISWTRNVINKLKQWWTAATDLRLPWAVAVAAATAFLIISLWTMTSTKPELSRELLAWDAGIEDNLDHIELKISELYSDQDYAIYSDQSIESKIDLIESNMRSLTQDLETMTF